MRFATIRDADTLAGVRVEGDRLVIVDAKNAVEAYRCRSEVRDVGELTAAHARYAPVSPSPAHILCVGLNYRSHLAELGRDTPEYPAFFAKFPSSLTGPIDDIVLPAVSDHIDAEVELALVVGRRVHRESAHDVRSAIAGFTVANDMSMRD